MDHQPFAEKSQYYLHFLIINIIVKHSCVNKILDIKFRKSKFQQAFIGMLINVICY